MTRRGSSTHVWNDAMEDATLISKTMLASRKLTEVSCSSGYCFVIQFEH